jgi:SynChlorMet cassette protein ScmC
LAVNPSSISVSELPQSLKLDLADGQRWLIRPVDDRAATIVAELGRAMRLEPACTSGRPGEAGRELCVAVCEESGEFDRSDAEARGVVVCRCADSTDPDKQVLPMERIACTIAREALVRGGLLLHGALAEYKGIGFIMAGPGTIGKSTASRRLPLPWRSLSDDKTLVVRDGNGRFRAHPWPTWSRFYDNGPGGSWAVEDSVPLRAIFFLAQSPSDAVEPVNATQATALTLESAVDLAWEMRRMDAENAARALYGDAVSAALTLASAVPAYTLKLSLEGRFWEEIERVLPQTGDRRQETGERVPPPGVPARAPADGSFRVVYTGPSMNPTLHEPDLLEVKPYGTERVRPGDVVYFKSPEKDLMVVHRVVAVERRETGDGRPTDDIECPAQIDRKSKVKSQEPKVQSPESRVQSQWSLVIRTRGDNNLEDDPALQPGDIIGRVTAAQRGARRRVIHGGRRGLAVLRSARLGRAIQRGAGLLPHTLYCHLARLGPFDRALPAGLRPRLVRFNTRYRPFLKLLMGRRAIGHYDFRRAVWRIRRPFRLFVDEKSLPCPESTLPRP